MQKVSLFLVRYNEKRKGILMNLIVITIILNAISVHLFVRKHQSIRSTACNHIDRRA